MRIKKILRSRLPERFAGKVPPLLIEVAIGIALPVAFLLIRMALLPWMGTDAPFALVFVAVVGAAVLAGWRSGLLALLVGQLLVWFFIMPVRWSFVIGAPALAGALVLSTVAQGLILLIIALYQREVAVASSRRETQLGLLEKALREIDHRTSNNYQTVLALVLAQSKSAQAPEAKEALLQVADRIRAIAAASTRLAVASQGLQEVRIGEHLDDLCKEIERGLSRDGVSLDCEFEDMVLSADQTVSVSILINELVTNALKHAFPDGRAGTIQVGLKRVGGGIDLTVEDNGVGLDASGGSRGTGLGKRLIDTFVKQLDGKHLASSNENGTRHRIRIPA